MSCICYMKNVIIGEYFFQAEDRKWVQETIEKAGGVKMIYIDGVDGIVKLEVGLGSI